VSLLLEHGADPNAVDNFGNNPLFYTDNVDIAGILLEHGADVNGFINNQSVVARNFRRG
jgi:ankyrin repeat protein